MKGLSMSTGGMRPKKMFEHGPLMDRQDSAVKRSMKSVMKLGRANRPKMLRMDPNDRR